MSGSSSSSASPTSAGNTSESGYWVDADGTAHDKSKLLVFVGGDFLGESPIDPGATPELGYRRSGVAYFCPDCGEVWGRLVLVDHAGRTAPLDIAKVACEAHPDQWEIPGSLLGGYRGERYLNYLPAAALHREFVVHLNWINRQGGQT